MEFNVEKVTQIVAGLFVFIVGSILAFKAIYTTLLVIGGL